MHTFIKDILIGLAILAIMLFMVNEMFKQAQVESEYQYNKIVSEL